MEVETAFLGRTEATRAEVRKHALVQVAYQLLAEKAWKVCG